MRFTKMHGAGNDFCLFDGFRQEIPPLAGLARAACDRHFGVGGDGVIAVTPSASADARMTYYNSDGTPGEMCGNGLRCTARFAYEKGLVGKREFLVETGAGVKPVRIVPGGGGAAGGAGARGPAGARVEIGMGRPEFDAARVPAALPPGPALRVPVEARGRRYVVCALRVGVPHCVVFVEEGEAYDVERDGAALESAPAFPEKANVHFVRPLSRGRARIQTYERGAGHTLACGTGCCAAAAAGARLGLFEDLVAMEAEGGLLEIRVGAAPGYALTLTGPAEFVCDGELSPWVLERALALG